MANGQKNYMRWWKAGGKKVAGKKKGFHKKDSLQELDRGHQIDALGGNLHSFATGPEWAASSYVLIMDQKKLQ